MELALKYSFILGTVGSGCDGPECYSLALCLRSCQFSKAVFPA